MGDKMVSYENMIRTYLQNKKEGGKRIPEEKKLLPKQTKTLTRYNDDMIDRNTAAVTRKSKLSSLVKLGRYIKKPYENMTEEDLRKFMRSLRGKKQNTRSYHGTQIKMFFKWLYKFNKRGEYPPIVENLPIPTMVDMSIDPSELLTPKEVMKIVNAAENQRDRALLFFLFESACRVSEVVSPKIKDVEFTDWGGAKVRVLRAKSKGEGRRPDTVLCLKCTEDLKQLINYHPFKDNPEAALFYRFKTRWDNDGKPGESIGEQNVREIIKRYSRIAGIPKYKKTNPHSWRKASLTQRAREGYNERFLEMAAGWSRGSKMARKYTLLDKSDLERKIMEDNGLIPPENKDKVKVMELKECSNCKHMNSPANKFCCECKAPLDITAAYEKLKGEHDRWDKIEGELEELRGLKLFLKTIVENMDKPELKEIAKTLG